MDSSKDSSTSSKTHTSTTLSNWQLLLLPFMLLILGSLTLFSTITSIWQFNRLYNRLETSPSIEISEIGFTEISVSDLSEDAKLKYIRWKSLTYLEKIAVEQRYNQANTLVLARTWTKYQGFVTGMVLALVGATFILGKLQEEASNLDIKGTGKEISIKSTSPGLILAFLGTVLILFNLFAGKEVEVIDSPLFTILDSDKILEQNSKSTTIPTELNEEDFETIKEEEMLEQLK